MARGATVQSPEWEDFILYGTWRTFSLVHVVWAKQIYCQIRRHHSCSDEWKPGPSRCSSRWLEQREVEKSYKYYNKGKWSEERSSSMSSKKYYRVRIWIKNCEVRNETIKYRYENCEGGISRALPLEKKKNCEGVARHWGECRCGTVA